MREDDRKAFAELYRGVCANYGREAIPEAMRIAWSAFVDFDFDTVQRAYGAHVATSRFAPTVADIRDKIISANPTMQRLGADEAFALMPRSEDDSVVWTEEMAYAWSVASNLVNECTVDKPDWSAARMAFKDAYNRAVDTAKAQNKPVKWMIARGLRKDNLEDVLTESIRLGRVSSDDARPHLSELEYVRPVNQQLLLEGAKKTDEEIRAAAMEAVSKLRGMLKPNEAELEAAREEAKRYCDERDDRERKVA